jgi:exosortase
VIETEINSEPTDAAPPATAAGSWSAAVQAYLVPTAGAVVAAVLAWAYAPELRWLWETWGRDPNYSHGYLVIPMAALVFWRRRGRGSTTTPPWQWGWLLLAVTLTARNYCHEQGHQWAETVTLLPALGALALTLGGWGLFRRAWPAIAYLLFMVPLPARLNALLAQPLQTLATDASTALLRLSGVWVIAEGNVIYVGRQPLNVADACNGLSMLMCLLATVAATVLLVPMSVWVRAVLVVSAVPIALASNVLRIAATAWCVQRLGAESGARIGHDLAGWLMMPMALLLVGLELGLLAWLVREEEVVLQPLLLGRPIRKNREGRPGPGPGVA